ncbi:nuclear receptor coactivator 5-like [Oppia nitens]|uniref:nuclear receptor coactivator 5-like n=1 Tax=Oppia nitens TaxID=1686743 RepID=UPI0023DA4221|nr:nuclear receptor coactivator 5-like [Oppia nitens]
MFHNKSGQPPKGGGGRRDRSRSPMSGRGGGGRPTGGPTGTRHGARVPNMNNRYDDRNQFGPPSLQQLPPPQMPDEPIVGNEAEIIVVERDQWSYADMIEKRVKSETGIQYCDMLFLHTPDSLNMTLNDLFDRQTLYAIVVAPLNEKHRSITIHVLHNQTEHRNMPLEDALQLLTKDFMAFTGRSGPIGGPPPSLPLPQLPPSVAATPLKTTVSQSYGNSLPEDVAYLLRTILSENGPQFLSLAQIDILIEYFERHKSRLTCGRPVAKSNSATGEGKEHDIEKQKATLLENPHVQAALSSLIQIGALTSGTATALTATTTNTMIGVGYTNQPQNNGFTVAAPVTGVNQQPRRHPLFGTEIRQTVPKQEPLPPPPQMIQPVPAPVPPVGGTAAGLIRYPPPQSYSQYYQQYY